MIRKSGIFGCIVTLVLVFMWAGPTLITRAFYAAEVGTALAAREQLAKGRPLDLVTAFRDVAKAIGPSVVNISTTTRQGRPAMRDSFGDDVFRRFFGQRPEAAAPERQSLGTGVIVSVDGYVVTNNHVVRGADVVTVTLADNRSFKARLVGSDQKTDVAVLKIDVDGLLAAPLGDSDALEVGDWVLATGNPFGLSHSVSCGIVSAKGRANMGIAEYEDFIQCDAAINPGNSGGPLVDLRGNVVGIATAIASRTGGSMGIGFAIPSNMVKKVMDSIIEQGRVRRGWLGVLIQSLDAELARSFNHSGDGVLVVSVTPDGPAEKAGLQADDIVESLGGRPVADSNQLRNAIAGLRPGLKSVARVFRQGETLEVEVEIGELADADATDKGADTPTPAADFGLLTRALTPEVARSQDLQATTGALVTEVVEGSVAARLGIRPRDVILSANGARVDSPTELSRALVDATSRQGVRLLVESPDGAKRYVVVR